MSPIGRAPAAFHRQQMPTTNKYINNVTSRNLIPANSLNVVALIVLVCLLLQNSFVTHNNPCLYLYKSEKMQFIPYLCCNFQFLTGSPWSARAKGTNGSRGRQGKSAFDPPPPLFSVTN